MSDSQKDTQGAASMVHIEEAAPLEPETEATVTETKERSTDGWTELMGRDLLHKVIESQAGSDGVQPQDVVIVDFVARVAPQWTASVDGDEGTVVQEVKDWIVVIGEKDLNPAAEMGVRFMHVGDRALLWSSSKFAYGQSPRMNGDFVLPPDSNILFDITVKAVIPENEVRKAENQIKLALSKKEIGNDIYSNEWSSHGKARAKQQYKRSAELMEYLFQTTTEGEAVKSQAFEILLDCLNNIAALHLRGREYKLAKEAAVKVLEHDPDNFKGLIRAAKASLMDPASSLEEVDAALMAASKRTDATSSADLDKLRADFVRRKQAYKKKSKEIYSKMGKGILSEDKDEDGQSKEASEEVDEDEVAKTENVVDDEAAVIPEVDQEGVVAEDDRPWWKKLPWWQYIIPYGFQLCLPMVMYYVFTIMKSKEASIIAARMAEAEAEALTHDEF